MTFEQCLQWRQHRGDISALRLQGIITHMTDVKPLISVATYVDDDTGFEVYQPVTGESSILSIIPSMSKTRKACAKSRQLSEDLRCSDFLSSRTDLSPHHKGPSSHCCSRRKQETTHVANPWQQICTVSGGQDPGNGIRGISDSPYTWEIINLAL